MCLVDLERYDTKWPLSLSPAWQIKKKDGRAASSSWSAKREIAKVASICMPRYVQFIRRSHGLGDAWRRPRPWKEGRNCCPKVHLSLVFLLLFSPSSPHNDTTQNYSQNFQDTFHVADSFYEWLESHIQQLENNAYDLKEGAIVLFPKEGAKGVGVAITRDVKVLSLSFSCLFFWLYGDLMYIITPTDSGISVIHPWRKQSFNNSSNLFLGIQGSNVYAHRFKPSSCQGKMLPSYRHLRLIHFLPL